MPNAVIYARFSSHTQTEQSIEGQLRDCHEFARRNGLSIVGEYIDRALTGRYADRPDFQRMITDAAKRQFTQIIVWKLDRFARNRYDSAIYKHKLRQHGVKVISAMENIGDNPEGILLEALLEASAEYYSVDLSEKVKRGQRESREKGLYLGGAIPVGYRSVDKRLVPDERVAPQVRAIFSMYADGARAADIVNSRECRAIRSCRGNPLSIGRLNYMLHNEVYAGVYRHSGVEVPGVVTEAIVSREVFDRAQARLEANRRAPAAAKAKVVYALQGKAYCGYCGARLVGESGRGSKGAVYNYYACGRRKKTHACQKKNERRGFVEWYAVEQTVKYVLRPDIMERIASAIVAQYDKDLGKGPLAALERQAASLERELERLVDSLTVAPQSARARIFARMERLEGEKADLEIDIAKLKVTSEIHWSREQILAWLRQFGQGDPLDPDFQRKILDTFVNTVYLYDERMVIFYNIRGGKQVSYMDMLETTKNPGADALPQGSDMALNGGGIDTKSELAGYVFVNGLFGVVCGITHQGRA